MRFLCVYRSGKPETNTAPSQQEMAAMGKLIEDMSKAGVLLATEGCQPSSKGARVRIDSGKFTATDGPFPETKELIGGFCLLQVKSKEEAIEWVKRFLRVVGEGESEIRLLHDFPAG
jgi:hypothetical protein